MVIQVTPAAAFTEYNELNIEGLYMYEIYTGPNTNKAGLTIEGREGRASGSIGVYLWDVYDGPKQSNKYVGRARGLTTTACITGPFISFTLVFQIERFRGSTLQVMGTFYGVNDWAIVGGTSEFAMATGVIIHKIRNAPIPEKIHELKIRAFYPKLKVTNYPVTKIGPIGGSGGYPKDITGAPRRLENITVSTGWIVDSISFSYIDNSGQKRSSGRWGGSSGQHHTIQLAESEVVTQVSGTVTIFERETVISSIKFVTNLSKTYGPWGGGQGAATEAPFSIPVPPGSAIVGFFARAATYLNAIGVHVRPL